MQNASLGSDRAAAPRPRRDRRLTMVVAVLSGVAALGYGISFLPDRGVSGAPADERRSAEARGFEALAAAGSTVGAMEIEEKRPDPASGPESAEDASLREARRFLRQRRYDDALRVLDAARDILKARPEAYLLLGRALEGKRDFATARDFYNAALDRDPWMYEAHWGFATTSEALGDLESALGAMRAYLHTERDPDPTRLRINQARSAIWEWEAKLGRGPWGPTRGIPPGFSEADLKRDGRGVGVKWPRLETLSPDGTMKAETKSADKIQIYPRP